MDKIFKNWIIILALVFVAGIGAYAYINPPKGDVDFSGDISNWKEYKDENLGFSFKYPGDMNIIEDTENTQTMLYLLFVRKIRGSDAPIFGAAVLPDTIDKNRGQFENGLNIIEAASYAGKEGFKVKYGDAGCAGESVVLPLKENTLIISSGYCEGDPSDPEENKKVYDKVLETLQIE